MVAVIAVLSQKGGSGKTCIALGLAVAHEQTGGRAAVLDLDSQRSAVVWGQLRGGEPPQVLPAHASRLAQTIRAAQGSTQLVVIDGPAREAAGAAEAARLADLVLIPARPAVVDLAALPATLEVVSAAGTRAMVVLNACPPRGPWTAQAADAVRDLGAEVAQTRLGARVAHSKAFMVGKTAAETEPRSPAAAELAALYTEAMS